MIHHFLGVHPRAIAAGKRFQKGWKQFVDHEWIKN